MSTDHRPSVDQLLTDASVKYRPTIGEVSAKCRRSVGKVSVKCRRSVGEVSVKCRRAKSYIGRDTSGTTIDRVSTECRPTIDRLLTAISTEYRPSVDRLSTDCRPTIDRLSTNCRPLYRPLYRPIPRSTLPIVNKIPLLFCLGTTKLLKYSGSFVRGHTWDVNTWDVKKVSVTRAGCLQECKNTAFVSELSKTGFCKSVRM